MRISDWSSDVCSSDLSNAELRAYTRESNERTTAQMSATEQAQADAKSISPIMGDYVGGDITSAPNRDFVRKFMRDVVARSEERRVGHEWGSTCRTRWWPDP